MKKLVVFGLMAIVSVVGCDSEDSSSVGEFSSSLSAEPAAVEELTFAQQDTFCAEVTAYQMMLHAELAANMTSAMSDCGIAGEEGMEGEGDMDGEAPSCEDVDYTSCTATVAEVELCLGVSANNAGIMAYSFFAMACPSIQVPAYVSVPECEAIHAACSVILGSYITEEQASAGMGGMMEDMMSGMEEGGDSEMEEGGDSEMAEGGESEMAEGGESEMAEGGESGE